MEQYHFVLAEPELLQGLGQRRNRQEQVADQHDDAATADLPRQLREHIGYVGLVVRLRLLHLVQHQLEVVGMRAGGKVLFHLSGEGDESHRVLLLLQHVSQAGRAGGPVIVLVPIAAVFHGLAGVENDGALEVGLFLVFLDIEAVGLGPDLPVDVADVVAGGIFAMRGEFHRKAVVGATVLPIDKPLHNEPRPHIQPLDAVERFGVQIGGFGDVVGGHGGAGTVSG